MPTADSDYFERLMDVAFDTKSEALPARVMERTGWMLADCLGVSAAGMQADEMQRYAKAVLRGPGPAWVCGTADSADAMDAAFLNGIAGTWYELDEGHTLAKGHPAIQVVPAAFAVAQEIGSTGRDVLAAVALGYEISSRINQACRIRPQIHPHGTFGVMGAAIAVARLRRLPKDVAVQAVRIAAGLPLATSYHSLIDGATARNVFTGHSAFMGMHAVLLALAGFTGETDAVRTAYAAALAQEFDPAVATAGLGQEWLLDTSYFKLSPTARSVHPAIDAAEDALAQAPGGRVDPAAVTSIRVRTYDLAAAKNQQDVRTDFGAKFSVPFAVATCIVHNASGLASFGLEAVGNAEVQRLTRLADLSEDPAMTARYPGEQPCTVTLTMRDGAVHTGRCDIVRGEAGRPVTLPEIRAKFMDITHAFWRPSAAARLFDDCLEFGKVQDVKAWSASMQLIE